MRLEATRKWPIMRSLYEAIWKELFLGSIRYVFLYSDLWAFWNFRNHPVTQYLLLGSFFNLNYRILMTLRPHSKVTVSSVDSSGCCRCCSSSLNFWPGRSFTRSVVPRCSLSTKRCIRVRMRPTCCYKRANQKNIWFITKKILPFSKGSYVVKVNQFEVLAPLENIYTRSIVTQKILSLKSKHNHIFKVGNYLCLTSETIWLNPIPLDSPPKHVFDICLFVCFVRWSHIFSALTSSWSPSLLPATDNYPPSTPCGNCWLLISEGCLPSTLLVEVSWLLREGWLITLSLLVVEVT